MRKYAQRSQSYMDPAGRVCTNCDEYKLWEYFGLSHKKTGSGFRSRCRQCESRRSIDYKKEFVDSYGYVSITGGSRAGQRKHRVIMAIMLGRELEEWENVHHINGVKTDNHYDNLELWVIPQPAGQRLEDLVDWVCQTYPDLVSTNLRKLV